MNELTRIPLAAVPDPSPVVRLRGFSRVFGDTRVLDDLDLEIAPGEFVALLGRSGSGKTTLLRTLAGLDPSVGQDLRLPGTRATVFQDARLLPWKRVWQNVVLGLGKRTRRDLAASALEEVGLGHRWDAWPLTLSGGEAQRASLARALIRKPELLLLDEPFAALDALTRIRMHALVLSLWQQHRPAVLLVTHDVEEAMALADRILVLDRGRIAAEERIGAPRGSRGSVIRSLRASLLGHLGLQTESGVYADLIGRKP
ncbi:ABC transporter ATP-binding protein [Sphingomonas sp. CGMCC 1.13654]|uniref:ABC transporter ATP-binding protein n=1 Tax=Sphingomonas chungangi TaxID=2683589 RepID=A0A838L4M1_9SPHN|nr:ABC transporter ATP-binding protein [Sphingomonas chungangi]MBA2933156.1 ABC transporter ATP-binding protein [Sphingomonas chungangi]MVW57828.1 ATP-binding cassette domain-containing protein [Sphingomonas chungangi]